MGLKTESVGGKEIFLRRHLGFVSIRLSPNSMVELRYLVPVLMLGRGRVSDCFCNFINFVVACYG